MIGERKPGHPVSVRGQLSGRPVVFRLEPGDQVRTQMNVRQRVDGRSLVGRHECDAFRVSPEGCREHVEVEQLGVGERGIAQPVFADDDRFDAERLLKSLPRLLDPLGPGRRVFQVDAVAQLQIPARPIPPHEETDSSVGHPDQIEISAFRADSRETPDGELVREFADQSLEGLAVGSGAVEAESVDESPPSVISKRLGDILRVRHGLGNLEEADPGFDLRFRPAGPLLQVRPEVLLLVTGGA